MRRFDETSAKRGHDYITLFFALDLRKLLFGTEGKDNATVVTGNAIMYQKVQRKVYHPG